VRGTSTATLRPNLHTAFPTLPGEASPQFNRLVLFCADDIERMTLHLVQMTKDSQRPYQALNTSAMPVRDCKRRGHSWLAAAKLAGIGWSNSLGWYEGCSLFIAVNPSGEITGYCFGAASTADQPLAESFFAQEHSRTRGCQAPARRPACP
jgi:hypothetical protein